MMVSAEGRFYALIIVPLITTLLGFYKFLYYISVGYGLSISSLGITFIVCFFDEITIPKGILIGLLIVYGLRLSIFLLRREFNSHYSESMKKEIVINKPFFVKVIVWISCAGLYSMMASPVYFVLKNKREDMMWTYVGICIGIFGFLLETFADRQKSQAKEINPKRFVDTGLYRIVRCPNYLGEILFWTGIFISGIQFYQGVKEWICPILAYISIVWIMLGGCRRLEIRQNKNYGKDIEYQHYVKTVPIIFPLIPLYSVKDYKWLVG